jgi:eukaryotic-like serine/threonine-protein kinase
MPLLTQLNTLESVGLIRLAALQPELEYLFRHALVQDAAYGSLLKNDRKRLHQSAGEALEQFYAERVGEIASTLALHFEKAEQRDKAIHYFILAGDRARASYANSEAIQFYQAAIAQIEAVASSDERLCQLYEQAGELLNLLGRREDARQYYAQAMTLTVRAESDQWLMLARLHRKTAISFLDQRAVMEATQNFAAGERVLQSAPSSAREWWQELIQNKLDQLWMYYTQNQPETVEAITQEVKPWLEAYGNAAQKARFYFGVTQISLRRLRYNVSEEMRATMQLGLQAAQESDNPHIIAELHFGSGFMALWTKDFVAAQNHLEAALQLSEQIGNITFLGRSLTYLVVLHRVRKDGVKLQALLPRFEQALASAQLGEYMPYPKAIKAWFALQAGQLDDAQRLAGEALALWQGIPFQNPFHWLAHWPFLGAAMQQNNLPVALEQAKEMLMPMQQKLPDDVTAALEAAVQLGESGELEAARAPLAEALRLATEKGYL